MPYLVCSSRAAFHSFLAHLPVSACLPGGYPKADHPPFRFYVTLLSRSAPDRFSCTA